MPYFDRLRTLFGVGLATRTVTVLVVDDDVVLDVNLDVTRLERPATADGGGRGRPGLLGAGLLTHRIASAAAPRPRSRTRRGSLRPSVRRSATGVRLFVDCGQPWAVDADAWSE